MNAKSWGKVGAAAGVAGVVCFVVALHADLTVAAANQPKEQEIAAAASFDDGPKGVIVAEARARAKLMYNIYAATLDSMHHHFFRRERSVLPARALEDVFAEIENQTNIKAGWISVNTKAMSIHHEPKTKFEKQAAKAIAAGKGEFEVVEDGYYRRVGAISLGAGCVNCHTGFFSKSPQTQRFAGLVICVPINKK